MASLFDFMGSGYTKLLGRVACVCGVAGLVPFMGERADAVMVTNVTTGQILFAESFEEADLSRVDGTAYASDASPQIGSAVVNSVDNTTGTIAYRDGSLAGYPSADQGDWYLEVNRPASGGSPYNQPRFIFDIGEQNAVGDLIRVEFRFRISIGQLGGKDSTNGGAIGLFLYNDTGDNFTNNAYANLVTLRGFTNGNGDTRIFNGGNVTVDAGTHGPNQWNTLVLEYVNGNANNEISVSVNGGAAATLANSAASSTALADGVLRAIAFGANLTSGESVYFIDGAPIPEPASLGMVGMITLAALSRCRAFKQ